MTFLSLRVRGRPDGAAGDAGTPPGPWGPKKTGGMESPAATQSPCVARKHMGGKEKMRIAGLRRKVRARRGRPSGPPGEKRLQEKSRPSGRGRSGPVPLRFRREGQGRVWGRGRRGRLGGGAPCAGTDARPETLPFLPDRPRRGGAFRTSSLPRAFPSDRKGRKRRGLICQPAGGPGRMFRTGLNVKGGVFPRRPSGRRSGRDAGEVRTCPRSGWKWIPSFCAGS